MQYYNAEIPRVKGKGYFGKTEHQNTYQKNILKELSKLQIRKHYSVFYFYLFYVFVCSWEKGTQLFKQNQTYSFFFYCLQSSHTTANLTSNCRPVSILPNMPKIYKRLLVSQINEHFTNIFPKYRCGFQKVHGTHFFFQQNKLCKCFPLV